LQRLIKNPFVKIRDGNLGWDIMTEIKEHYSERKEEENAFLSEPLKIEIDSKYSLNDINKMFVVTEEFYKLGRYLEILEFIPTAIDLSEKAAKKVIGEALSIALLSSNKVIDSLKTANIKDMELGIQKAEALLIKTKSDYLYENYHNSAKSLNELSILTSRLQVNQREGILKIITDIESELQKVKGFGTNTKKAKSKLNEAKKYLECDKLVQTWKAAASANEQIEEAKSDRILVISETVSFVEKLIEAASEIGADIDIPAKEMEKAKAFFSQGHYQMCMFITIKAEQIVTDIIHSQANKVRSLQRSLVTRFKEVSKTDLEDTESDSENQKNFTSDLLRTIEDTPKISVCPHCENQMEYYDRYRRWYCSFCQKYL
jgi:hypothetical protein